MQVHHRQEMLLLKWIAAPTGVSNETTVGRSAAAATDALVRSTHTLAVFRVVHVRGKDSSTDSADARGGWSRSGEQRLKAKRRLKAKQRSRVIQAAETTGW